MNYSTVYLLSYSILVIILVCANVISAFPQPNPRSTFSAKVLDIFRTKCGIYPDNSKTENYITQCNGVEDQKGVKPFLALGSDLCLGVVNNIIASCDNKTSNNVLEYFSEKNPEKFKNLSGSESICPIKTLEIQQFLYNNTLFKLLSDNLKDKRQCDLYCYEIDLGTGNKKVNKDCSLWHDTNVILENFNQTSTNNTAVPSLVNSDVTSQDKKLTATDLKDSTDKKGTDLKGEEAPQKSTDPKVDGAKINLVHPTQISPKKEEKQMTTFDKPTTLEKEKVKEVNKPSDGNGEPSVNSISKITETGDKKKGEDTKEGNAETGADPEISDPAEEVQSKGTTLDSTDNYGLNANNEHNESNFENDPDEQLQHSPVNDDNEDNLSYLDKYPNKNPPKIEEEFNSKSSQTSVPVKLEEGYYNTFDSAPDSHFFYYFLFSAGLVIMGYVAFHNKNKILAYALEGKRSRNLRRRPNSASYRKLECSLEEAITSNSPHSSVTNVVY